MPNTPHDRRLDFGLLIGGSHDGRAILGASMARSEWMGSPTGIRAWGLTTWSRRACLLGLAASALVAPALSGCGSSSPTLNTATVERAIARSILAQRNLYATVGCPSKVPRKVGFAFTCTAHLEVGRYPVSVTETNGDGHVRYENQAPLVVLKIARVERAIEQSILGQRHLHATATCPAEVIQEAGIVFTCTAAVAGQRYPFAVTEVDGDGHVRYVGLQ